VPLLYLVDRDRVSGFFLFWGEVFAVILVENDRLLLIENGHFDRVRTACGTGG
jgi:hypothetical protein